MIALKVSGLLLNLISTIVLIVSVATNQWVVTPTISLGLWAICRDASCTSIPRKSVVINTTRSFLVISILFLVLAVSMQISAIKGHNFRGKMSMQKQAGSWSLIAGIIGYYVFKKEIPAQRTQPEPVPDQTTQFKANPNTVQPGAVQQYPVQPGVIQLYPGTPVPNQPYQESTEGFVPNHEPPPAYAPQPDLALSYPQYPVQAAFPPQPEKHF